MNTKTRCCFIVIVCFLASISLHAEAVNTRLVYIGDEQDSGHKGALQGLEEANLQGEFLGQSYEMTTLPASEYSASALRGIQAVVVSADSSTLMAISRDNPGLPVFNISATDNSLRYQCLDNVLHIAPSDQMLADAEAQWRKKNPDSRARGQAWHADFVKFAARDLNKRFSKTHGIPMDDEAWSGWAAVKMLTDTIARENLTEPSDLLAYLKTKLAFDGQKGLSMDFRPTGQLNQIILLVENGKIVAEAPVRGIAKPPTVQSLGILDCGK